MRRRLDVEMVRRGIVGSRAEAANVIRAGNVTVAGRPAAKASTLVLADEPITMQPPGPRFVSRGGEKLDAALGRFGVEVSGRFALDAGASSGGFTDCLLARGAAHVVAVDVGYGQLDWRLRGDPRVTVLDRTNVRDLRREDLPYAADLVVADLSFISLLLVLPSLIRCAANAAEFVLLVKPQFEAAREEVGPSGVVTKPEVWASVLSRVAEVARGEGIHLWGVVPSSLLGPAGNVEFFLHGRPGEERGDVDLAGAIRASVREGEALRRGHG